MEVKLKNVRLGPWPDLFKPGRPPKDKPNEPGRYGCTLIMDMGSENHEAMKAAVIAVAKEKWPEGFANIIKSLEKNKVCLRKGDTNLDKKGVITVGFEGKMYARATNASRFPIIKPIAKKPDGSWNEYVAADGKPYAGCYVNAVIDVYAMSEYGNAINAKILGIQFVGDGDAFKGGSALSGDGFDDVEGATTETSTAAAGGDDFPF